MRIARIGRVGEEKPVVTEAASGIGLAVARALHLEGARVFGLDLVRGKMQGLSLPKQHAYLSEGY